MSPRCMETELDLLRPTPPPIGEMVEMHALTWPRTQAMKGGYSLDIRLAHTMLQE